MWSLLCEYIQTNWDLQPVTMIGRQQWISWKKTAYGYLPLNPYVGNSNSQLIRSHMQNSHVETIWPLNSKFINSKEFYLVFFRIKREVCTSIMLQQIRWQCWHVPCDSEWLRHSRGQTVHRFIALEMLLNRKGKAVFIANVKRKLVHWEYGMRKYATLPPGQLWLQTCRSDWHWRSQKRFTPSQQVEFFVSSCSTCFGGASFCMTKSGSTSWSPLVCPWVSWGFLSHFALELGVYSSAKQAAIHLFATFWSCFLSSPLRWTNGLAQFLLSERLWIPGIKC